jgi:uncharacterized protein YjbI with pentapeptide repeats
MGKQKSPGQTWNELQDKAQNFFVRGKRNDLQNVLNAMEKFWLKQNKKFQDKHPCIKLIDLTVKGSRKHPVNFRGLKFPTGIPTCLDGSKIIHADCTGADLSNTNPLDATWEDVDMRKVDWGRENLEKKLKRKKQRKKLRKNFEDVLAAKWLTKLIFAKA